MKNIPKATFMLENSHKALSLKIQIFWDIAPCCWLSVSGRFGQTLCLRFHANRDPKPFNAEGLHIEGPQLYLPKGTNRHILAYFKASYVVSILKFR